LLTPAVHAELRLSTAFGDHMVLQQQMPIRVWGWADAAQSVAVQLRNDSGLSTQITLANNDGRWMVELPARDAGGSALTLTVTAGDQTITRADILMGEVWICSGQSNMEFRLNQGVNGAQEVAAANHPTIRLFDVPGHVQQDTPQEDARGQWQVCTPESAAGFSGVGYFFGRALSQELEVPIGLIGTNWGGTRIEPWTPPVGFAQVDEVTAGNGASGIYNGMVAGLTPMSARGVIWYQGESNAGQGLQYEFLKRALVLGWRSTFQNDELSFYWVQLANFGRGNTDDPAGGGWGPVREGQRRALSLPHTGMAVITDIGTSGNIHPPNKQDVGARLALWALANDYDRDIEYSGPLYRSHTVEGNRIRVSFDHVGEGLMVGSKEGLEPVQQVENGTLGDFAIQGADGAWHWATAEIDGDTVVVYNADVAHPTAVRYAYRSDPLNANLYNRNGLPASPFTTVD